MGRRERARFPALKQMGRPKSSRKDKGERRTENDGRDSPPGSSSSPTALAAGPLCLPPCLLPYLLLPCRLCSSAPEPAGSAPPRLKVHPPALLFLAWEVPPAGAAPPSLGSSAGRTAPASKSARSSPPTASSCSKVSPLPCS
ncbi:uncharacterized protein LOC120689540 [Panicum virgatum]|uniref:uncharacterized protein LOC120689540 n=1 Tax=Panicum virgatum TaxID=38727 RepID=UPI0019D69F50|nr:uncharacterized protein LOC120689540 [Panicum virgatum]